MSRLKFALLCIVIGLPSPAAAQERVLVGTQRLAENGALFLAAAQGYFKAEGIDLGMTAYESDQAVAETLTAGTTDFGLATRVRLSLSTRADCPHQANRC
jgi:NitT/TauT family transport system substrate-binding protein